MFDFTLQSIRERLHDNTAILPPSLDKMSREVLEIALTDFTTIYKVAADLKLIAALESGNYTDGYHSITLDDGTTINYYDESVMLWLSADTWGDGLDLAIVPELESHTQQSLQCCTGGALLQYEPIADSYLPLSCQIDYDDMDYYELNMDMWNYTQILRLMGDSSSWLFERGFESATTPLSCSRESLLRAIKENLSAKHLAYNRLGYYYANNGGKPALLERNERCRITPEILPTLLSMEASHE